MPDYFDLGLQQRLGAFVIILAPVMKCSSIGGILYTSNQLKKLYIEKITIADINLLQIKYHLILLKNI